MKKIVTTVFLLFSTNKITQTTAGFTEINKLYSNSWQNQVKKGKIGVDTFKKTYRLTEFLNNRKGCWCNFHTRHLHQGRGRPLDVVDAACKNLFNSYACVMRDVEEEKEEEVVETDMNNNNAIKYQYKRPTDSTCQPSTAKYHFGHLLLPHKPLLDWQIRRQCDEWNLFAPNCIKYTCYVEVKFVQEIIINFSKSAGKFIYENETKKDGDSHFDPQMECLSSKYRMRKNDNNVIKIGDEELPFDLLSLVSNQLNLDDPNNLYANPHYQELEPNKNKLQMTDQFSVRTLSADRAALMPIDFKKGDVLCCGNYPTRAPYRPENSACCGKKIYGRNLMMCCDESESKTGIVC